MMQTVLMNSLSRALTLSVLFLGVFYQKSFALTCYDNTGKDGEMRLVSNDDWTFCSLVPESPVNKNSEGKVYGLGPANDDLAPYMLAFANNDDKYQVLSMCIYERYDFRGFSPKFSPPEVLFRCVCNYDKCNSRTSFGDYLDRLAEKPRQSD